METLINTNHTANQINVNAQSSIIRTHFIKNIDLKFQIQSGKIKFREFYLGYYAYWNTDMRVQIKEVQSILLDIILSKGAINKNDAETLAGDYIEGELNGKKSHGLTAFVAVVPKLSEKRPEMEIIKESESVLYIEAN